MKFIFVLIIISILIFDYCIFKVAGMSSRIEEENRKD